MNCIPVLEKKGYNLRGYSPDTYYYLRENNAKSADECEALFFYLEHRYG
jgi:hypothetical protein